MPRTTKRRQRLPRNELRAVLPVTFPESQARRIQDAADALNLSRSAFIRAAAVEKAEHVLSRPAA